MTILVVSLTGCSDADSIDTIADGLRTMLGPKTFEIIRQQVDDIINTAGHRLSTASM